MGAGCQPIQDHAGAERRVGVGAKGHCEKIEAAQEVEEEEAEMSDIVHWLRKLAALVEADHAPQHVVMHMRAGADEIERLRAGGCARDQSVTQYCAEAATKDAEIASLLRLLADERTESMRLRAVLEPFACMCSKKGEGAGGTCLAPGGICRAWNARAALEGRT